MSHYERRLQADKTHIRERIVAMGRAVEVAVGEAIEATLAGDKQRGAELILADLPINRESRAIDRLCHGFVARHLPSAGHLRFVSSVLRLNVSLERVGDYAVTICREAAQLEGPVPEPMAADLRNLGLQSQEILSQAMEAFEKEDAELAWETKPMAAGLAPDYDVMFRALASEAQAMGVAQIFALAGIFTKLQRVSDQAKNICEETIFAVTGQTKPPKRYKVLFVDARASMLAPLAQSLAAKAFPNSGAFSCAGWAAAGEVSPELSTLADQLGLELVAPLEAPDLSKFHVVVALAPDARRKLGGVPFHTVLLEWALPSLDTPHLDTRLREIARELSSNIADLMTTMRGEDAD